MNFIYESKNNGKELITNQDAYLDEVNKTTILAITNQDLNIEQFKSFLKTTVIEWEPQDCLLLDTIKDSLNFSEFNVIIPDIYFVKTDGRDNFNLAYTRENTIFMSPTFMIQAEMMSRMSGQNMLKHIIAHEIFHIISRNNPEVKNIVYKELGFYETETPDFISDYLINPDTCNGKTYGINYKNQEFVGVISQNTNPMMQMMPFQFYLKSETELLELSPMNPNAFMRQFDTYYVYHPEEIGAEYFATYITGNHCSKNILKIINKIKNF